MIPMAKTGADINLADELFERAGKCSGYCTICGIMGMAPLGGTAEQNSAAFSKLHDLLDYANTKFKLNMTELSMGMSGDYLNAIAAGSTIVRVGTAIFGRSSAV